MTHFRVLQTISVFIEYDLLVGGQALFQQDENYVSTLSLVIFGNKNRNS